MLVLRTADWSEPTMDGSGGPYWGGKRKNVASRGQKYFGDSINRTRGKKTVLDFESRCLALPKIWNMLAPITFEPKMP